MKVKNFFIPALLSAMTFSPVFGDMCNSVCDPCCNSNVSFFLDGEYLYWEPSQTGMTYALSTDSIANGPLGASNEELQQKFNWQSGFRLGAGAKVDGADAAVYWTRLHETAHTSSDAPFIVGTQLLGPANPFTVGGVGAGAGAPSSTWKFRFDTVEVDFGYELCFNGLYTLHPYLGVVGARIDQTQTITYENFFDTTNLVYFDAEISRKNNFRGVGPKIGLDGRLEVGYGLGLMGNLATTFFYGKARNPVTTEVLNNPLGFPVPETVVDYEQHRVIPSVQGQVGISWNTNMECFTVNFAALYEVQYLWGIWRNQNSYIQNLYIADAGYGNLVLQGLTVELTIGF